MKNPVFLTLWLMAVASFAAQAGHHEADEEQSGDWHGALDGWRVQAAVCRIRITHDNLAGVDRRPQRQRF